jgi:hypothetical protein
MKNAPAVAASVTMSRPGLARMNRTPSSNSRRYGLRVLPRGAVRADAATATIAADNANVAPSIHRRAGAPMTAIPSPAIGAANR